MTYEARLMSGIILLTVPTIAFGGYFMLKVLQGKLGGDGFTLFQKAMFRAGHAHAGVLVILAVLCQLLIDNIDCSSSICWMLRAGFGLAALLVSGGFFAAGAGKGRTTPNSFIIILYIGALVLTASVLGTGIALIAA